MSHRLNIHVPVHVYMSFRQMNYIYSVFLTLARKYYIILFALDVPFKSYANVSFATNRIP